MFFKIKFAFFYWLIWIFIFELSRLAFLLYNFRDATGHAAKTLLQSFFYGLRMDASMASYISIPVCIFLVMSVFLKFFTNPALYKIYTAIVLLPALLIIFCDLPAYKAWGHRLDVSPMKYLTSPKEAWASVSNLPVFRILLFFLITYFLSYQIIKRIINSNVQPSKETPRKFLAFSLMLIFTALQIIPLRGGLQLAPINQSSVYFSHDNLANLAAINVPWNFMRSILQHTGSRENPFIYLDSSESKKIKDSLLIQNGQTEKIIDLTVTPDPNIILVVWESFTDKAIHLVKNGHEITQGFNELKKQGVYFSNIYATGDRTDKGIVALLGGYPAQPTTSIIKIPEKANKIPKLVKLFSDKGYHTSFYYGGELEFANIKAYILGSGFQQFTSKADFDDKDQNSKWGAHDHVVKNKLLSDFQKMQSPFFTTWLTLSSHEPYETPVSTVIPGNDDESLFLNSLHYTDSTLFDFVSQCSKQSWWNNTVMVIIADHGHRLPFTGKCIDDFKIPMLWLGGALIKKGIEIKKTASQIDLPATLSGQLFSSENIFPWSKNILQNNEQQWAYFAFSNGFGFVDSSRYMIFDNVGRIMIEQKGNVDETYIKRGKALQQETFADYLLK